MRRVRSFSWLLMAGSWLVLACEPTSRELAQKCAKGDPKACRRACYQGVFGSDGCLGAARTAALPLRGKMLDEACHGKVLEGCLEAGKLHLETGAREKLAIALDRACTLGHADSCSKLGNLRLASSTPKALAAYRRGCHLAKKDSAGCEKRAQELVDEIQDELGRCQKDELAACEKALTALASKNHDAAYVAAERICAIRGLGKHYQRKAVKAPLYLEKRESQYGQCGLFLVARASVAGAPSAEPVARPVLADEKTVPVLLSIESLELHFKGKTEDALEKLVEVKRELTRDLAPGLKAAAGCFATPEAQAESLGKLVRGNFIVDHVGEALDVRASGELTNPALGNCVVHTALPEKFTGEVQRLERIPIVDVTLKVAKR